MLMLMKVIVVLFILHTAVLIQLPLHRQFLVEDLVDGGEADRREIGEDAGMRAAARGSVDRRDEAAETRRVVFERQDIVLHESAHSRRFAKVHVVFEDAGDDGGEELQHDRRTRRISTVKREEVAQLGRRMIVLQQRRQRDDDLLVDRPVGGGGGSI